eukprot:4485246-Karenia_brevis.AAC.1
MHEKKKALMDKLAIEIPNEGSDENKAIILEERKALAADLEALNSKIPEYIDLGRNLVSIIDHVASWMADLMWKRLDGISRGDEEEWNRIE